MRLQLIIAAVILGSPLAHAADCKQILGLHGFKAQAQVSCGYGQRPNEAIEMARNCARRQNPTMNMAEINQGVTVFKLTEVRMGHQALCQDVTQKFPGLFYAD